MQSLENFILKCSKEYLHNLQLLSQILKNLVIKHSLCLSLLAPFLSTNLFHLAIAGIRISNHVFEGHIKLLSIGEGHLKKCALYTDTFMCLPSNIHKSLGIPYQKCPFCLVTTEPSLSSMLHHSEKWGN
jgi:hypothetical protein